MTGIAVDERSLLASIPLFASLSADEIEAVLEISVTRSLRAREILFRKGDEGDELYGILEGQLRASTASAHGKEVTFSVMGPGEVFGEIALFDRKPRSATIEAVGPARVVAIHRDDFLAFMDRHPGMAHRMATVLAQRVRRVSGLIEDILFLNVPSRLARRLLALGRLFGRDEEGARVRIELKLSPQELGDLIGVAGEPVERQLELWASQGLIARSGDELTLLRRESLEEIAEIASL